jgi:hemerythrin superfamily protein
MDAITMLRDDHRTVEKLFKRFEDAGARAFAEKRKVVDRITEELSVHAAVEEQVFYPVTRATVPSVAEVALESLEEHHVVEGVLSELEDMHPEDERFVAKVTVLIETVRHHVRDEETEYFREVRSELGGKALNELGEAMAKVREGAPTRPHPRLPDTRPGNIAGAALGVVDHVGSTLSGIAQGSAAAAQDVIDRIPGRKRRRRAPTGPRQARKTAASVRGRSDDAIERVIAAVLEAKASSQRVAEDVRSGAARTAKAGKASAKPTSASS